MDTHWPSPQVNSSSPHPVSVRVVVVSSPPHTSPSTLHSLEPRRREVLEEVEVAATPREVARLHSPPVNWMVEPPIPR